MDKPAQSLNGIDCPAVVGLTHPSHDRPRENGRDRNRPDATTGRPVVVRSGSMTLTRTAPEPRAAECRSCAVGGDLTCSVEDPSIRSVGCQRDRPQPGDSRQHDRVAVRQLQDGERVRHRLDARDRRERGGAVRYLARGPRRGRRSRPGMQGCPQGRGRLGKEMSGPVPVKRGNPRWSNATSIPEVLPGEARQPTDAAAVLSPPSATTSSPSPGSSAGRRPESSRGSWASVPSARPSGCSPRRS